MTSAFSWQNSICLCPASLSTPTPNLPSRYFLTFYFFCVSVPYNEKDIFLGVLALEGLVGLHRTVQLQLLKHTVWGSLRKTFLFLLAILWISAFKWLYLPFSPLLFAFLLFTAICKPSSGNHFAFFAYIFHGDGLDPCLL